RTRPRGALFHSRARAGKRAPRGRVLGSRPVVGMGRRVPCKRAQARVSSETREAMAVPTPDSELDRLLEEGKHLARRRRRWALASGRSREPRLRFETQPARQGDLEVTITATGKVQGVNTVEVGAEVSGRVIEVLVDHNAQVRAGDLLARIDPEPFEATLEEAVARLHVAEAAAKQAEANLEEAEANLVRAEAQGREGLIAQQDLDAIRAAAARARAQVASAKAQLRLERANVAAARTRLDRTEIRSPIDGMVLSRLVEPGQTV